MTSSISCLYWWLKQSIDGGLIAWLCYRLGLHLLQEWIRPQSVLEGMRGPGFCGHRISLVMLLREHKESSWYRKWCLLSVVFSIFWSVILLCELIIYLLHGQWIYYFVCNFVLGITLLLNEFYVQCSVCFGTHFFLLDCWHLLLIRS